MSIKEIECTILDDKYKEDDYEVLAKIIIDGSNFSLYGWDGLEWSKNGFNRVYTNRNSQFDYDEFLERLYSLRDRGILYEIAKDLKIDQSYLFEEERIYIYIESKSEIH